MRRRERILLGIGTAALALFVVDALLVTLGLTASLDRELMLATRNFSSRFLDTVMLALTTLGWGPVVIPLVVVFAIWSLFRGDRPAAVVVIAVGLCDEIAIELLKLGFARARPELWPRMPATNFAFPSGHAATSVAVFGILAAIVARRWARARVAAWVVMGILAFGIGVSRVYLGAHWPSDVIGGWLLGTTLLTVGLVALLRWPMPDQGGRATSGARALFARVKTSPQGRPRSESK